MLKWHNWVLSFIHLLNQHLWIIFSIPGTLLWNLGRTVSETQLEITSRKSMHKTLSHTICLFGLRSWGRNAYLPEEVLPTAVPLNRSQFRKNNQYPQVPDDAGSMQVLVFSVEHLSDGSLIYMLVLKIIHIPSGNLQTVRKCNIHVSLFYSTEAGNSSLLTSGKLSLF